MIPDIQNELNRKVGETLQNLLSQNGSEIIDDEQLFRSIKVLWDAVAGLVDSELMDLMTTLLSNQEGVGKESVQVYANPKGLIGVTLYRRIDNTASLEVKHLLNGKANRSDFGNEPGASGVSKAVNQMLKISEKFQQDGYRRLL